MKFYIKFILSLSIFSFLSTIQGQNIWQKTEAADKFILNSAALTKQLKLIGDNGSELKIKFPNYKGELIDFTIKDNALLPKNLQEKYSAIHSYKGKAINDSDLQITFTCITNGIKGTLIHKGKYWSIENESKNLYSILKSEKTIPLNTRFKCQSINSNSNSKFKAQSLQNRQLNSNAINSTGKNLLRTFRTAIAASGEYSNFFIKQAGVESGSDSQKKTAVLEGIVTSLNRINIVFERDLGVRFELVPNNDLLIFLDSNTDPFTKNDTNQQILSANTTINNIIGFNNYDIGHLVTTGFAGSASIKSVCSELKGRGVSGFDQPNGFFFDFTLFAHELGHQLGGNHTQNYPCERSETGSAVEIGSGSTIMGYAAACSNRSAEIQSQSDSYFHYVSILEIKSALQSFSCINPQNVNNNFPVITSLQNYTIPVNTPFALDVLANDIDGDNLTYTWEQIDDEKAPTPPKATSVVGPLFRSLPPTNNSRRDFPNQLSINTKWQVLPSVARQMKFGLTVRDSKTGGVANAETTITTIGNSQKFEVTSQNSNIIYPQNSNQLVTWNIAETNLSPINVNEVKIELSFDGGNTYTTLLENTPNDGSELIIIPSLDSTTEARIRVSAIGNIFYSLNKSNFTISNKISSNFPDISITNEQYLDSKLLIFRIKTPFNVTDNTNVFYKFDNDLTMIELDFKNELMVSLNGGLNSTIVDDNFIVFPKGSNEVLLTLPLREKIGLDDLEKIKLTLTIPKGTSNRSVSNIASLVKLSDLNISLFPTLVSNGVLNIKLTGTPENEYKVNVFSVSGNLVYSKSFTTRSQIINLSSLSTGIYFVSTVLNNVNSTHKIVVY